MTSSRSTIRQVAALEEFVNTSLDEAPAGAGPGVGPDQDRVNLVASSIVRHLLRLNSEFAHYVAHERQSPRVELAPSGDPSYFPVGVKHRYTRR